MTGARPVCQWCGGRGGWHDGRHWHRCKCVQGSAYTAKIADQVRANIAARTRPQQTLFDVENPNR